MFSAKTSRDDLRPHKCQDLCSETLNRGVTCNTNVKLSGDNKVSVAAAFSHSAARSSSLRFSHSWRTPPTRRPHLPLARLFRRKSCAAQRRPILPVGEHPPLLLLGYSQPQREQQTLTRMEARRQETHDSGGSRIPQDTSAAKVTAAIHSGPAFHHPGLRPFL